MSIRTETATFGAGCFWGVEEVFRNVRGVRKTSVGYMGGSMERPSYEDVCTDGTGHAEVVQVEYDPLEVSYGELLEVFWGNHDPTTMNRQGPDEGTQYRSAIFFHSAAQKKAAEKSKAELGSSGVWGKKKIVTQIVPAAEFWRAEEYHQQYLKKSGRASCHF
jgi:peptide-methionine (S)-S-oxide reductase